MRSNTSIKPNHIESVCFNVNSFNHANYGNYCFLFPLNIFRENNLRITRSSIEGQSVDVYPNGEEIGKVIYIVIHILRNNLHYMENKKERILEIIKNNVQMMNSWIKENKFTKEVNLCKKYSSIDKLIDIFIKSIFPISTYTETKAKCFNTIIFSLNEYGHIGIRLLYFLINKKGYHNIDDNTILEQLFNDLQKTQYIFWERAIKYCLKNDKKHLILPIDNCLILTTDKKIDKIITKSSANIKIIHLESIDKYNNPDDANWKVHNKLKKSRFIYCLIVLLHPVEQN